MGTTNPKTSPTASRTRRVVAVLAGSILVVGLLAGCGSDGDDASGDTTEEAAETEAFCRAIANYAEKAESGDKVAMADTLGGLDGVLTEPERRIVEAHITALTTASGNHPGGDRDLREDTEASLRTLADENCGEGSLPVFDRSGDVETDDAPDSGDGDTGDTETDADMGDGSSAGADD